MKTLKEELQEIVDKKKISGLEPYICNHLTGKNEREFHLYKGMAKDYAKEFFIGLYAWWRIPTDKYVISEKYRFIKDLIAIL